MANLKFADTHNMVAFLSKREESDGFEQIVDFLNAQPIRYALTVNPTIYTSCIEQLWSTVKAKTINGEVQLHALVDGKKIIFTESTVKRYLQLEDAEGVLRTKCKLVTVINLYLVGIKSLLDAVRITDAQVYVNTAQLELVLLRDFKESMLSVYYC
ncbi:hypothetical protein Tco_1153767 [Tanacetum coccineum]